MDSRETHKRAFNLIIALDQRILSIDFPPLRLLFSFLFLAFAASTIIAAIDRAISTLGSFYRNGSFTNVLRARLSRED